MRRWHVLVIGLAIGYIALQFYRMGEWEVCLVIAGLDIIMIGIGLTFEAADE